MTCVSCFQSIHNTACVILIVKHCHGKTCELLCFVFIVVFVFSNKWFNKTANLRVVEVNSSE